jgi:hypothetical protein
MKIIADKYVAKKFLNLFYFTDHLFMYGERIVCRGKEIRTCGEMTL